LLEKLTVTQLVKKFPAFCGTLMFSTVFTRDRHCSYGPTLINAVWKTKLYDDLCIFISVYDHFDLD